MDSAHLFRGYLAGEAFYTNKGFRGVKIDTLWSQYMIASFLCDDTELASIALSSSLADIEATVDGGYYGSPYSIGEYGFFADTQFNEVVSEMQQRKRNIAKGVVYLSEEEWKEVDSHIEDVIRHSTTRFKRVVRGDTLLALAVITCIRASIAGGLLYNSYNCIGFRFVIMPSKWRYSYWRRVKPFYISIIVKENHCTTFANNRFDSQH